MIFLSEIRNDKNCFDAKTKRDLQAILSMMEEECISLVNWQLVEIPTESTYCFYNKNSDQAFDVELDDFGILKPHYYEEKENSTITKFPADSIKEAVRRFSL
ncbi:hypothetical protein WKI11_12200 [Enterococcus avium]|uniref:hypothetical protein n=1 Tax=Enterococcus avium TaxID=33945 RepID=UPI000E2766DF|nr:hypothetical protein CF160_02230 [Enterococcus pseudoavium]